MTDLTREQQRAKIRAEMIDEVKNPDVWYPITRARRDKLKSVIHKDANKPKEGA